MTLSRTISLLLVLALLGGAACAQVLSLGAENALRRADALAAKGDTAGAIAQVEAAAARYPTVARLHTALAGYHEAQLLARAPGRTPDEKRAAIRARLTDVTYREDVRALFDIYARAAMFAPPAAELRARAASWVGEEFPLVLGEYAPLVLPGEPTAFSFTFSDPAVATGVWTRKGLITTKPLPAGARYQRDPKYGQDAQYLDDPRYSGYVFQRMLAGYEFDRADRRWRLRFRVMWQDVPNREAERAQQAQDVARILLRASGLVRGYTGLTPRFSTDGVVNVWLAEKGEAGGEAFGDSLYLHVMDFPRSDAEWVRELFHEYGHHVFQAVGGYTDPEWAANGRLGERIILRWLLKNPDPRADALPWLQGLDGAELRETKVFTPMRRFANAGPASPGMRGTGNIAMDGFVGFALYLEAARGGPFLAEALGRMTMPAYAGPGGFLDTVESLDGVAQGITPRLTLRLVDLPRDLPLWVYLVDGNWQGAIARADTAPVTFAVTVNGQPCATDGPRFTTPPLARGWHKLVITPKGGAPSLAELTLARQ